MAMDPEASKTDQDRIFDTIQREIIVSAREQGNDTDHNFRLRNAIRRAHAVNMPQASIDRARKQGTGEPTAPNYQDVTYEGYGPDGVAVIVEAITADPRQTRAALHELFEAHHGNLGEEGCVSWQFQRRGLLRVDTDHVDDEEAFMLQIIDLGADELGDPLYRRQDEQAPSAYRVYCGPTDVRRVDHALEDAGYPVHDASVVYDATQHVPLPSERARHFLGFFEKLTALPSVHDAYANWEVN